MSNNHYSSFVFTSIKLVFIGLCFVSVIKAQSNVRNFTREALFWVEKGCIFPDKSLYVTQASGAPLLQKCQIAESLSQDRRTTDDNFLLQLCQTIYVVSEAICQDEKIDKSPSSDFSKDKLEHSLNFDVESVCAYGSLLLGHLSKSGRVPFDYFVQGCAQYCKNDVDPLCRLIVTTLCKYGEHLNVHICNVKTNKRLPGTSAISAAGSGGQVNPTTKSLTAPKIPSSGANSQQNSNPGGRVNSVVTGETPPNSHLAASTNTGQNTVPAATGMARGQVPSVSATDVGGDGSQSALSSNGKTKPTSAPSEVLINSTSPQVLVNGSQISPVNSSHDSQASSQIGRDGAQQPGIGSGNTGAQQPGTGSQQLETRSGNTGAQQPGTVLGKTGAQQPGTVLGNSGVQQPGTGSGNSGAQQPVTVLGNTGVQQPGTVLGNTGAQQPGTGSGNTGVQQPGTVLGNTGAQQPGTGSGNTGGQQPGTVLGNTGAQQPGTGSGNTGAQQPGTALGNTGAQQPGTGSGNTGAQQPGTALGNTGAQQHGTGSGNIGVQQPGTVLGNTGAQQPGTGSGNTGAQQPGTALGNTGAQQPGTVLGNTGAQQPGTVLGNTGGQKPGTVLGNTVAQQPGTGSGNTGAQQPGTVLGNTGGQQPGTVLGNTVAQQPGTGSGNTGAQQPGTVLGNTGAQQPGTGSGNTGAQQPGTVLGNTGAQQPATGQSYTGVLQTSTGSLLNNLITPMNTMSTPIDIDHSQNDHRLDENYDLVSGNQRGSPNPRVQSNQDTHSNPGEFQTIEENVPSSGHFFAYFLTAVVICISGYVIFHNKQKILAFIVEGRSGGEGGRRRGGNVQYSKLKSNVEEVMPSLDKATTAKNFVY